jgi:hypothetical protein
MGSESGHDGSGADTVKSKSAIGGSLSTKGRIVEVYGANADARRCQYTERLFYGGTNLRMPSQKT